ncbi:MAG: hypothetical protein JSR76_08110 [Verrucomicrobia bacterium]|nr:hypothetical protein [Verrucomicrobiota bacterium]
MQLIKVRFPSEEMLREYLFTESFFKDPYYIAKGITEAVALLAGRRFAGRERFKRGIPLGASVMAQDIQEGKDPYKEVEFRVYNLKDEEWADLGKRINDALLACAVRVADTHIL